MMRWLFLLALLCSGAAFGQPYHAPTNTPTHPAYPTPTATRTPTWTLPSPVPTPTPLTTATAGPSPTAFSATPTPSAVCTPSTAFLVIRGVSAGWHVSPLGVLIFDVGNRPVPFDILMADGKIHSFNLMEIQ
jgi:hypothetical protein